MSVLDRPDPVPVPLGYCPCEGSPHPDGDIVYLRPELSVPAGVKARSWFVDSITGEVDSANLQERIAAVWLEAGVMSWTFLDDDGEPIPVTPENIALALPYGKGGRLVADRADDLYVPSVVTPLEERLAALSKRGQTASIPPATSPQKTSTSTRRKRSSTATTGKVPPLA